jgi:hypothetical protein
MLFSADALAPDGTVAKLLRDSERFAGDLAKGLRERIYVEVVPQLASAIAAARKLESPTAQDLALTYSMALTIAIENDLRGTLRNFGLKVGMVGKVKFEASIKELVENLPDLAELVEPLLLSGGRYASRSSSCIAVCWPSSGMMRCAGA